MIKRKNRLGEEDWKKLLLLLQIGFEIDISLSDVEAQNGKVLWRFYCFEVFFSFPLTVDIVRRLF